MITNPGKPLTIYDVTGLVNQAFLTSFSKQNIIIDFYKSGIWPLNRDNFTKGDFLMSSVTDRLYLNVNSQLQKFDGLRWQHAFNI